MYYIGGMTAALLAAEPVIRLAVFAGVLAALALWELAAPRRRQEVPRVLRWSNNLAVVAIDTLLVRFIFPLTAVAWAGFMTAQGWGLLNAVELPAWLAVIIAFVLLDLAIYAVSASTPAKSCYRWRSNSWPSQSSARQF
jgi:sterol desaturase/sphingolipid hydroxylase (fatty acid hydroxylase superfamily)